MDMGIAMCHFELATRELNLPGEWALAEPGNQNTGREDREEQPLGSLRRLRYRYGEAVPVPVDALVANVNAAYYNLLAGRRIPLRKDESMATLGVTLPAAGGCVLVSYPRAVASIRVAVPKTATRAHARMIDNATTAGYNHRWRLAQPDFPVDGKIACPNRPPEIGTTVVAAASLTPGAYTAPEVRSRPNTALEVVQRLRCARALFSAFTLWH